MSSRSRHTTADGAHGRRGAHGCGSPDAIAGRPTWLSARGWVGGFFGRSPVALATGRRDRHYPPIIGHQDLPAPFVNSVMMGATEQGCITRVRLAPVQPVLEMMTVAS